MTFPVSTAEPNEEKTLEQWARDMLELAVKEGLVRVPRAGEWGTEPHPQARSAGELVAVANMLKRMIVAHDTRQAKRNKR